MENKKLENIENELLKIENFKNKNYDLFRLYLLNEFDNKKLLTIFIINENELFLKDNCYFTNNNNYKLELFNNIYNYLNTENINSLFELIEIINNENDHYFNIQKILND